MQVRLECLCVYWLYGGVTRCQLSAGCVCEWRWQWRDAGEVIMLVCVVCGGVFAWDICCV